MSSTTSFKGRAASTPIEFAGLSSSRLRLSISSTSSGFLPTRCSYVQPVVGMVLSSILRLKTLVKYGRNSSRLRQLPPSLRRFSLFVAQLRSEPERCAQSCTGRSCTRSPGKMRGQRIPEGQVEAIRLYIGGLSLKRVDNRLDSKRRKLCGRLCLRLECRGEDSGTPPTVSHVTQRPQTTVTQRTRAGRSVPAGPNSSWRNDQYPE
jgi:hypothetical protein